MIDPKIRTLLMVDAMGSYTKAAQALSLTQPDRKSVGRERV